MKVGFELEGFTDEHEQHIQLRNGVRACGFSTDDDPSIQGAYTIEVKSPPMKPKEIDGNVKALFGVLDDVGFSVNSSCGLHVHISLRDQSAYFKLRSWEFAGYFQRAYARTFRRELEKFRLMNRFCKAYENKTDFERNVRAQLAANDKTGVRYKAINYNSYNLYNTVEFRVFPATTSEKKLREYVAFAMDCVEVFLKKCKVKVKRFEFAEAVDFSAVEGADLKKTLVLEARGVV